MRGPFALVRPASVPVQIVFRRLGHLGLVVQHAGLRRRPQGRTVGILAPGAALICLSLVLFVAAGPLEPLLERVGRGLADPSLYVRAVLG